MPVVRLLSNVKKMHVSSSAHDVHLGGMFLCGQGIPKAESGFHKEAMTTLQRAHASKPSTGFR